MLNKHNILCLDIYQKAVERVPILASDDVRRLAEGLKTAYTLNPEVQYEIYFYRESSMNKKHDTGL